MAIFHLVPRGILKWISKMSYKSHFMLSKMSNNSSRSFLSMEKVLSQLFNRFVTPSLFAHFLAFEAKWRDKSSHACTGLLRVGICFVQFALGLWYLYVEWRHVQCSRIGKWQKMSFFKMAMAILCHLWNYNLDNGSRAWIKALSTE